MKKREVITIGVAVLVVGLLFVVLKLSGNNSTPPVTEEPVTEEPEREASGTRNTKELKRGLFDPPRHSGDSNKPKSLSDADVERLLKEAVDMESLEERDGLYYQPNESEPFSGWAKTMSDSEYGKGLTQFKDGKPDGPHTQWHGNGQKGLEGTFKDGEQDGLGTMWYENGQKKAEGTLKDGNEDGLQTYWYKNGQKRSEGTFKDGEKVGLQTKWYENGQKKEEETYKNGNADGLQTKWRLQTKWHENGQKKEERTFKDGIPDGLWAAWHENGQKKSETTFKDGKELSAKYWNRKGEEVETAEEIRK